MKVWYLYHSGVAVRTGGYLLIFDYWKNHTLPGGIPALIQKENCPVLVFCSHAHDDHFNPEILQWRRNFSKVEYILSDDIASQTGCTMLSSGAVLSRPDYTVRTFASTDAGVAFLVEIDGVSIYHAGDLHWWHWSGEPDQENRAMASAYQAELQKLSRNDLDLSFVPVDGRLGDAYALGIDYFAAHVACPHIIPIHFSSDVSVLSKLSRHADSYLDRLCLLSEANPCTSFD